MGKSQRDKGNRFEREIVHKHRDAGIDAERVPLSGSAGGTFTGDVLIAGGTLKAECKARKDGAGFKVLNNWLEGNDLLFVKADREQPRVYMRWELYEDLIQHYPGTPQITIHCTPETKGKDNAV